MINKTEHWPQYIPTYVNTDLDTSSMYNSIPSQPVYYSSQQNSNINPPPMELNPHATPGAKLCYDFLNKQECSREKQGLICHYRHVPPNHPDAIADKMKNNRMSSYTSQISTSIPSWDQSMYSQPPQPHVPEIRLRRSSSNSSNSSSSDYIIHHPIRIQSEPTTPSGYSSSTSPSPEMSHRSSHAHHPKQYKFDDFPVVSYSEFLNASSSSQPQFTDQSNNNNNNNNNNFTQLPIQATSNNNPQQQQMQQQQQQQQQQPSNIPVFQSSPQQIPQQQQQQQMPQPMLSNGLLLYTTTTTTTPSNSQQQRQQITTTSTPNTRSCSPTIQQQQQQYRSYSQRNISGCQSTPTTPPGTLQLPYQQQIMQSYQQEFQVKLPPPQLNSPQLVFQQQQQQQFQYHHQQQQMYQQQLYQQQQQQQYMSSSPCDVIPTYLTLSQQPQQSPLTPPPAPQSLSFPQSSLPQPSTSSSTTTTSSSSILVNNIKKNKNNNIPPENRLCYEYLNKGVCSLPKCKYRHLNKNHPEAIIDRFNSGKLSQEEIKKYNLRKCPDKEVNPFAAADARLCFDFLNTGICKRMNRGEICKYRHLLPDHPEAIADKLRNLQRRNMKNQETINTFISHDSDISSTSSSATNTAAGSTTPTPTSTTYSLWGAGPL